MFFFGHTLVSFFYCRSKQFSLKISLLTAAALFLLFISGCNFRIERAEVEQEQASGLVGELVDNQEIGQSIQLNNSGLYRLDIYTATYARKNTRPVILEIWSEPPGGSLITREKLRSVELPAHQISNSGPTVILFDPLTENSGKELYFSIRSPGSKLGDAISIYHMEKDVYDKGRMFFNGSPNEYDLAFIAYTKEIISMEAIWKIFLERARQNHRFFSFYTAAVGAVLVFLLIQFAIVVRKNSS